MLRSRLSIPGLALVGLALALAPSRAEPQVVHNVHARATAAVGEGIGSTPNGTAGSGSDRIRFEPWGGVLFDAYRNEGGDGRPAWIGAARLGYELGSGLASTRRGWRLIGEVARAEASDAGVAVVQDSLRVTFRTGSWLATVGAEWDVIDGWTGVTLEARAGAAWVRLEITGGDTIPPGTPGTRERAAYDPFPAMALGLSVYRHLTHRVQLRLRVEDIVTDPFDALKHSPALGLGFRFVFE